VPTELRVFLTYLAEHAEFRALRRAVVMRLREGSLTPQQAEKALNIRKQARRDFEEL